MKNAIAQLTLTLSKDIAAGSHLCHECNRVTDWRWSRGNRYQRCSVCGQRFPCRKVDCAHADCVTARAAFARGVAK